MKKRLAFIIIILICFFNVWALNFAAAESAFFKGLETTAESGGAGYKPLTNGPSAYLAKTLGSFIAPVLAGVIGMLLLCYGGFIWMMSRGNEQEVERAKTIVTNTLIAMFVIFSAWAIVQLIIPLWRKVTTGQ